MLNQFTATNDSIHAFGIFIWIDGIADYNIRYI